MLEKFEIKLRLASNFSMPALVLIFLGKEKI